MKKILTIMVFLMTAGAAMAQTQISDEAGLRAIADNMNGDYILTDDITLSSDWTPLGTPSDQTDAGSFNGTLDGNGHTIIGLNFEISDPNVVYMGFFGRIGSAGVVKDLNICRSDYWLEGLRVITGSQDGTRNIGTIAGVNHGTILNCRSDVAIVCYTKDIDGGGIAGENAGLIKNCVYTGTITVGDYSNVKVGGIVGDNESGGTLQNCLVTSSVSGGSYISPLYGQDNGDVNDCAYQYRNNDDMWCVRLEGRSFYKDGEWNTLCLPFNVTIYGSCLNGATIKELDIEEPSLENGYEHVTGVEESTLYLNFKDVTDQIVAGKPYIIKWEPNQNNLNDPIFENASLSDLISGAIEPVPVNSLNGEVSFTGVFFSKDIEDENGDNTMLYLGSGNTTYYPSASMSINAMRAYFQLNGYRVEEQQGGGTVNVFTLNFDNETTAVKRIESKENQSEVVYDLSGRIVESDCLQPGIYIRGGKKFLIRK